MYYKYKSQPSPCFSFLLLLLLLLEGIRKRAFTSSFFIVCLCLSFNYYMNSLHNDA